VKKDHVLINEMFASVQGEGQYTGTPMLFIRTSGCNLRCSWCDQPDSVAEGFQGYHLKAMPMHTDEVMHWVSKQFNYRHTCLTGGEPTLQDLSLLVDSLQDQGQCVHIETNGTNAPEWLGRVDHICLSPKRNSKVHKDVWWMAAEVKLIIDDKSTMDDVHTVLQQSSVPIYLQPANYIDSLDREMVAKALHFVYQKPDRLRLSIQLHKVLGVH